ncbi:MAG: ABC-F type ribosomal protection protein [Erysipelotrichia bacterium]|nr:ABC-F type ribosomal protection protein [Erysipelotrichia bacterium]
MLLKINNGKKEFSGETLFENVNFEIRGNEKVAIIGRNGCGKTTLLKIIMGDEQLDEGTITIGSNVTIGLLSQKAFHDESLTVQESFDEIYSHILETKRKMEEVALLLEEDYSDELLRQYAALQQQFEINDGYNYNQQQMILFTKFGFSMDDLNKRISEFSGGQKTRLAFVRLLLEKPDILLLDEPTNHLDMATIEWLEGYLLKYPKAVVVVSHDRMFMDKIVSEVYEFEFGKLNHYVGNYTKYVELKKQEFERQQTAYKNQQEEIKRLEEVIEKFRYKKNKAAFAQSKIKYLQHMERVEKPVSDKRKMNLNFEKAIKGGNTVLTVEDLVIGYDKPLCNINMQVMAHDRIAVIGPNGLGKSTFLKTIMGLIPPISGDFMYGHQITVSYFDQSLAQVDSDKTVLAELWDLYPDYDHSQIRKILGSFLFTADEVFKTCNVLSGGEKVRLSLCKMMLSKANLLILDEPTNHLDIGGKEALESALLNYDGTVIFVSHDRYFINKLATKILYVGGDKTQFYQLNYQEYMDKLSGITIANKQQETPKAEKKVDSKVERENRKKVEALERQIEKAENKLEQLRELRYDENYYHDYQKMNQLNEEIDEQVNEVNRLMELWEKYAS